MKEEIKTIKHWISFRVKPEEYHAIYRCRLRIEGDFIGVKPGLDRKARGFLGGIEHQFCYHLDLVP